jgi:hypothetical protein
MQKSIRENFPREILIPNVMSRKRGREVGRWRTGEKRGDERRERKREQ